MRRRTLVIYRNTFLLLLFITSFSITLNCSDSLDKSPLSSIPDTEIPDDITSVTSLSNSLQIKGGSIERNRVTVYIRFEEVKYKNSDIWIRLSSSDSSYTFQEILNREPNNFINDVTYKYVLKNLSPGTDYYLWLVWKSVVEIEQIETIFKTLSK